GSLKRVVLDELHALVTSKRGDLLSLGLARLRRLAPGLTMVGLSATVREPEKLARFLVDQNPQGDRNAGHDRPSPPLRGRVGEGGSKASALRQAVPPSLPSPAR